ncbi:hypothetical protein SAMN05421856_11441 [Chryseobacterium taichungense]|uniref:Uncharacterized protein n=1 Tax=Chryseobacterium taichungense TaxID=295069 RepID=A0A1H8DLV8_9FLAO|nr:hypothetical protein [Chryseobacterium taichungense]SEN08260.1 hypothetical protein SAMN05421856_11441 [Chryseobacterium taichungense]
MDIQTRKLNLITYLAQLQDERFFNEIEEYILSKVEKEDHTRPFSIEELNKRIDQSLEDSKNDRIIESNDLLSEIKQWQ